MNKEYLKHFIGKICTIITHQINRPFTESDLREYFVTRVIDIDSNGVLGQHPTEGLMNYFCMANVISIQEEKVVSAIPPIENKKPVEESTGSSIFVNVNNLKKIVKDVKKHEPDFEEAPKQLQALKIKR